MAIEKLNESPSPALQIYAACLADRGQFEGHMRKVCDAIMDRLHAQHFSIWDIDMERELIQDWVSLGLTETGTLSFREEHGLYQIQIRGDVSMPSDWDTITFLAEDGDSFNQQDVEDVDSLDFLQVIRDWYDYQADCESGQDIAIETEELLPPPEIEDDPWL